MRSASAEFLLGSLWGLRDGVCADCSAKMMGSTRHEMVKAANELVLDGSVVSESGACASCQRVGTVARLR